MSMATRRAGNRARRKEKRKMQIDFETRSGARLDNYKIDPGQIAAVYYEEGGVMKRLDYDRSQFDELYAVNPQLATYAMAPWTERIEPLGDSHIAQEWQRAMDIGTEMHRKIERIMGGDMISGEPHTNTTPDYAGLEKRTIAWWKEQMDLALLRAMYGINPLENKYDGMLDTGRNPAKAKPEEETK